MEVDSAHNEARGYSAELFRVKGQYESCNETIESLRRENKNLAGKTKSLFLYVTYRFDRNESA
jgi:predicted nuclease with TOPRIM domain